MRGKKLLCVVLWCVFVIASAFGDSDKRIRAIGSPFHDMRTHFDFFAPHYDGPQLNISTAPVIVEVTETEAFTALLDVPETYGLRIDPLVLPTGFPAATNTWDAQNPLVDATTGGTYTVASGTSPPTEVGTPYCSGLNSSNRIAFDHVEDNDGYCLPAAKIGNSAGAYGSVLTAPAGAFDFGNAKTFSIAYLVHTADIDNAATQVQIFKGPNSSYLGVNHTNSACKASLSNGGSATDSTESDAKLGWAMCVFSYTVAGNQVMYGSSGDTTVSSDVASNTDAAEGGDLSGTITIGDASGVGVDLIRAWYWSGTALTAAQAQAFVEWGAKGIHDIAGNATAPLFRTGHSASTCWVDGKLESFGGAIPARGCSPNLDQNPTSADFATGMLVEAMVGGVVGPTVRNLQSRLQSGWTSAGTVLTTAQTVTPFRRGGRKTAKLDDNDAAAVEKVSQAVSGLTNTNPAETFLVCIYAATASGTGSIDVQTIEQTNAGCNTPTTTNWAAQTVTSTWDVFRFAGTFGDVGGANCAELAVHISPTTDITDVAQVSAAPIYAMVNVFWSESGQSMTEGTTCPVEYIDSTTAALEGGEQVLNYANAAMYNSGAFFANTNYILNTTRLCPTTGYYGSEQFLNFNNGGTSVSTYITINNADLLTPNMGSSAGTPGTGVLTFTDAPTMNDINLTGSITYGAGADAHTMRAVDDNEDRNTSGGTNRADPSGLVNINILSRADENVENTCSTINRTVVYVP